VTRDQIRDPNPNGKLLTGVVVSSLLRDTMSAPPGAESCMLTMRTGRGVGLWPPVKGESRLWCRCLDLLAVVVGKSVVALASGPNMTSVLGEWRVEPGVGCGGRLRSQVALAAWDGAGRYRRYRSLAGWIAGVWVFVLRMA
jgi:hypothetical protein